MTSKDHIEGAWHELKGKIKVQWGLLAHDEITKTEGDLEELSGIIQRKYGVSKEQADREIADFLGSDK